VQLCKTLCCALEQGTQDGLFRHMLRRSSARRAAELKLHGQAASSGSKTKAPGSAGGYLLGLRPAVLNMARSLSGARKRPGFSLGGVMASDSRLTSSKPYTHFLTR
jgi:hypothetical protein